MLDQLENLLGVPLSAHDYTHRIFPWIDAPRLRHRSPACVSVKSSQLRRCQLFDQVKVRERAGDDSRVIWKQCHAGFIEAALPIRHQGKAAGMLFAGPWRGDSVPESLVPGLFSEKSETLRKRKDPGENLPRLDEARIPGIETLLHLTVNLIERKLGEHHENAATLTDRKSRIVQFLEWKFQSPTGLTELALYLGVSASRTSQLVKQHFGKTFPRLLTERRLDHARALLSETVIPITSVAHHSGFSDPRYFYRRFLARFGVTARAFRNREQNPSDQV